MRTTYKLFFKDNDPKLLPEKDTLEYYELVDWEIQKMTEGIIVDGTFISGWLYWHLNHWWIRKDERDSSNNIVRVITLPDLRDNEWIRGEALEKCRVNQQGYMEVGLRQGGKALLNSSLLYTPTEEITIGDCQVGDKIYDDQGQLTTITHKFPQGNRPVYKITLVDGREINCDLNHNWKVYDRIKKQYVVKTTKELLENYKKQRTDWIGVRKNSYEYRYSIPNNEAVQYEKKELTIDPYFLGLWLGDGSNSYSKITSVDQEIIDSIYTYAKEVNLQVTIDDVDTFMITSGIRGGVSKDKNFVHQQLKPLYGNKHIPKEYLYSSEDQRMELLRGLMDSDGSCGQTGKIEFSTTDKQLAEDFYKLCRGLGINLSRRNKKCYYKKNDIKIACKDTTRFTLYTDKKIFKLSRKLNNLKTQPKYLNHTAIVNIEYQYDADTTCIMVDNKSHLFLTDNYTVTHNSEFEASFCAYNAILFRDTQNVIVGGNDNDLSLLKDKIDFGLKRLWEGIAIPRLDKTWRSNTIKLGYKFPNGEDDIWSHLIIRNADDGKNTETAAGTTAKSYVMDEIGKYAFSKVFEAAKPALNSEFGWRAIPILVGTGGSFDKGQDAERFFFHPDANNFLAFTDENTGKRTCLFMSGLFRQDCKEWTTLAKYLNLEVSQDSYLHEIKIKVRNEEKALAKINEEREAKKKDPDQEEYLKAVMYHPLNVEECFLSVSDNIFNITAAKKQQKHINENGVTGICVEIIHDGERLVHKTVESRPVSNFPHKHSDNKDAPVQMWEPPIPSAPYGLYTMGVDSYRQADARDSMSLGAAYIFKRVHNIYDEKFQNMFVAAYVARPEDKKKWNETVRNLAKYYNARVLVENDESSFIDYMISQGDEHYLEPEPQYLKGLIANSRVTGRRYGIHRSADVIRNQLHTTFKTYLEEVIDTKRNEDGSILSETLGFARILDPMLLEEIIKFNADINVDRIVAAELALSLGDYLNRSLGTIDDTRDDPRIKSYLNTKKSTSVFGSGRSIFAKKRTLF